MKKFIREIKYALKQRSLGYPRQADADVMKAMAASILSMELSNYKLSDIVSYFADNRAIPDQYVIYFSKLLTSRCGRGIFSLDDVNKKIINIAAKEMAKEALL